MRHTLLALAISAAMIAVVASGLRAHRLRLQESRRAPSVEAPLVAERAPRHEREDPPRPTPSWIPSPRASRHLSHVAFDWLLLGDTPGVLGFDRMKFHLVGVARPGTPCAVLETLQFEGERWNRISVKGRGVVGPSFVDMRIALASTDLDMWTYRSEDFDGPALRKKFDSMPCTDEVVGWSRFVADE